MSAIPNTSAYTEANAALAQAIEYEEARTACLQENDFTAAGHAGRLRDNFFDRACELELAGA